MCSSGCWFVYVPLPQGLVYPLDTVRTRLAVCSSTEYGGIWPTAVKLWRTEGFAAFYRGLVPSMVRQQLQLFRGSRVFSTHNSWGVW